MKTRISNFCTAILVRVYMTFSVLAILFEKRKKKKVRKPTGKAGQHLPVKGENRLLNDPPAVSERRPASYLP